MSETEISQRDVKRRFVKGGKPGPGRPKGARSKFSEAFIQDLASIWEERGIEVLNACATSEPGTFLKVCASLMPRDLNLSVGLGAQTGATLAAFRQAVALLNNPEPRALPKIVSIDAKR